MDRSRRTTVERLAGTIATFVPPEPENLPDTFEGVMPGIKGTFVVKGMWANEGFFKPWMVRPQESNGDAALCIMTSGKKYKTCAECGGYFDKVFKDSALCWLCKYCNDVDDFQERHCQCDGCVCVAINEGNKALLHLGRPASDVAYQLLTSLTKRELLELRLAAGGSARLRASSVGRQRVPEPRVPAPPLEWSVWWGGPVARGEGALREGTARERAASASASTPQLPSLAQMVELTTSPTSPSGVVIAPSGAQTAPSGSLAVDAAFLQGIEMARAVAAAEESNEAPTTAAPVAGFMMFYSAFYRKYSTV